MSRKSKNSSMVSGALQYGVGGATAGAAVGGPIGAAIGGGVGLVGGGIAGFLADDAANEANENDPDVIAARRREKSRVMMSAALGRAFSAMRTPRLEDPIGI